ncbi:MAG: glycosyltransferase family 2 protein [Baekduiaceae bacterium]
MTVVIPARDRPDRLAATLASVQAQDAPPATIVVVDDGSAQPLAPGAPGPAELHVIRHETSRGVAAARNTGIVAARTPWVALLDDDDLWSPAKLRLQLAAAERARADWVFGTALHVGEDGTVLQVEAAPAADGLSAALRGANVIPAGASNVLARRELLVEAGLFDGAFHHYADWDLWLRLAGRARAASIPEAVVGYVRHTASMQIADADSALTEFEMLSARHAGAGQTPLGGPWVDRWLAEGLWGAGRRRAALALMLRSAAQRRSPSQFRGALGIARARFASHAERTAAPPWARPATFRPPVD